MFDRRGATLQAGPFPLIVGIVGHRDLRAEDELRLAELVREELTVLRARCPHTDVMAMSSLAEGADRLGARVALDLGLRLIAPLPLPPDDYRRDFTDPASRSEFDALLAVATRTSVVTDSSAVPAARPEAYALAAAYVARHSHLLLALWDGRESAMVGSTAATVRARLDEPPVRFTRPAGLLEAVDYGVVHHIVTPRRAGEALGVPFSRHVLARSAGMSAEAADEAFHRACAETDRINASNSGPSRPR